MRNQANNRMAGNQLASNGAIRKPFHSLPRFSIALTIILLFVLLLITLRYTYNQLLTDEHRKIRQQVLHISLNLQDNVQVIVTVLEGLAAFVNPHYHRDDLQAHFENFAAGIMGSSKEIRVLQIFRQDQPQLQYPPEGNEAVAGKSLHELITDKRPHVREAVSRTIKTRQITRSEPYTLSQGGLGLVARKAIYVEDTLWGVVTIVLDMQRVLSKSGLIELGKKFDLTLRNRSDDIFWKIGEPAKNNTVDFRIHLMDGDWVLSVSPKTGWWNTIRGSFLVFTGLELFIFILTGSLVLFILDRQKYLAEMVRDKTRHLEMSRERQQMLFDANSDALFLLDREGNILEANMTAEQMYGYSKMELCRMNLLALNAPCSSLQQSSQFQHALKAQRPFIMQHNRKNSTLLDVEIVTCAVNVENRSCLLSSVRDISERIRAEKKLKKQNEILIEMEKIGKIGGWEFDTETMEGSWTPGTAAIHDLDPKAETNVEIGLNQFQGESRKRIDNAVNMAIAEGIPYNLELEITTGKGNKKWVRTIGKPVKEGTKVIGVKGTLQDITQFKKIELELAQYHDNLEDLVKDRTHELKQRISESEQLNKAMVNLLDDLQMTNFELEQATKQLEYSNQELESFSYSVSHDLRAPLRSLSGFAQLLEKKSAGILDETCFHYVNVISDSAVQMGELIDDLLNFSRIGRKELELTKCNMNDLVEQSIQVLQPEMEEHEINWEISTLPEALVDRNLMKLVWVNLISNALKYSSKNDTAVISIGHEEQEYMEQFYVKDNGSGFDMKYKHKLFQMFQRLHSQRDFKGTGVGLANVQRIILKHGGSVWAQSELGQGATFYFTLPKQER